jgi:hypothetical protein
VVGVGMPRRCVICCCAKMTGDPKTILDASSEAVLRPLSDDRERPYSDIDDQKRQCRLSDLKAVVRRPHSVKQLIGTHSRFNAENCDVVRVSHSLLYDNGQGVLSDYVDTAK